jgi:hypothetical protein
MTGNTKLYVYNLKDDNYDIDFSTNNMHDIIQMNDGNVIIEYFDKIKVVNIKEKEIEFIQTLNTNYYYESSHLRKFQNENILLFRLDGFVIYEYNKGKLIFMKEFEYKKQKIEFISDICIIDLNEIVIFCEEKGRVYGTNISLVFVDIRQNKIITSLIIGNANWRYQDKMILIDKNNLIAYTKGWSYDKKKSELLFVDIKTKKFKNRIKLDYYDSSSFLILNEKAFLLTCSNGDKKSIYQFEIENENEEKMIIKEKRHTELTCDCLIKYYNNKIIITNMGKVSLYE